MYSVDPCINLTQIPGLTITILGAGERFLSC